VLQRTPDRTLVRNFEGRTFEYPEPSTVESPIPGY
jgi:hypothetical protein